MIVEDDPMVAEYNRRYLTQIEGFRFVAIASSVSQAISVLEKTDVDLILLDVYMPGRNGFELLTYIRNKGKNIDVILITAAQDMGSVKKAMQYGAVDYLIKPFEFERFQEALLAYRKKVNFMDTQQTVSQKELDQLLLTKDKPDETVELPKGLTKHTLKLVCESILSMDGQDFSTEEIAAIVGLSRVSVRKYLHFLEDTGLLEVKIEYGLVGRPVTKHHFTGEISEVLKPYL
nr:response regulator [Paenibacillus caui]